MANLDARAASAAGNAGERARARSKSGNNIDLSPEFAICLYINFKMPAACICLYDCTNA